jgi:uncharacterized membrane protein
MNIILAIILLILCILVCGYRGLKTFLTLLICSLFILIYLYLISVGFPIYITLFILTIPLSIIILFWVNEKNEKTIASFISVIIVLFIVSLIIYLVCYKSKIQGFSEENIEDIVWCTFDIKIHAISVVIASIILGLFGHIIDTSTSVSTAVFELYVNNPKISSKELLKRGMTVGKDIIYTVTNTLLFAFFGTMITLFLWFVINHYSFSNIINNSIFTSEMIAIIANAIGSIIVIPITNLITNKILLGNKEIYKKIRIFANK